MFIDIDLQIPKIYKDADSFHNTALLKIQGVL
jgi:hypothetical protein